MAAIQYASHLTRQGYRNIGQPITPVLVRDTTKIKKVLRLIKVNKKDYSFRLENNAIAFFKSSFEIDRIIILDRVFLPIHLGVVLGDPVLDDLLKNSESSTNAMRYLHDMITMTTIRYFVHVVTFEEHCSFILQGDKLYDNRFSRDVVSLEKLFTETSIVVSINERWCFNIIAVPNGNNGHALEIVYSVDPRQCYDV